MVWGVCESLIGVAYEQNVEVLLREAGQGAAANLLVQYFGTIGVILAAEGVDQSGDLGVSDYVCCGKWKGRG